MVNIIDNRKRAQILFKNIEFGKPFYFVDYPDSIYVVADDDVMIAINQYFNHCDPDDYTDDLACRYVDLKIEIT